MEHVGVGEDQVRAAADLRPVVARRVAVVDRVAELRAGRAPRASGPGPAPGPWSDTGRALGARSSRASSSSTGRLKDSDLPDAVPLVTTTFPSRDGLERLELVRVEASMPAAQERRRELGRERVRDLDRLGRSRPAPGSRRRGGRRRARARSRAPSPPRRGPALATVPVGDRGRDAAIAAPRSASSALGREAARSPRRPRPPAPSPRRWPTRAPPRAPGPPTSRPGRAPRKSFRERATNRGRPRRRSSPMRGAGSRGRRRRRGRSRAPGRARSGPRRCRARAPPRSARRTSAIRWATGSACSQRLAVDARRALDVHEDVAAAALGHQLEHLGVGAAGDVVDRRGAGVQRPPRDLALEGVGAHRHAGLAGPGPRSPARAALPPPRRAPARPLSAGYRADVEQVEAPATPGRGRPATARSGVPLRAPSKKESSVTLTIPAASGGGNSSTRSARRQRVIRHLT